MLKKKKSPYVMFPVEQLVPGLYIDLGLPWTEHPFLFRRFKITSLKEITIIKGLNLQAVKVFPEQSESLVDDGSSTASDADTSRLEDQDEARKESDRFWQEKNKLLEQATQYRNQRQKIDREYRETIKRVSNLTRDLRSAPANAIRDAGEVIDKLTDAITEDGHTLMNMISLSDIDFSLYHHALNVTVLSLALAAAKGIRGDQLRELGIGAMLHDIGKIMIPARVSKKTETLTSGEVKVMETHPLLGGQMARRVKQLNEESIQVIEQHHEMLDGSGYPNALENNEISEIARIAAIANLYDNLCNPVNPNHACTPKSAMAIIYARYRGKLDGQLVNTFVRTMGVYPPGTVVQLSDDSIGLVVQVDPEALLTPQILLYNPDIPRASALYIDLNENRQLMIVKTLKPAEYPKSIYDYFGMHDRIGYFNGRRPSNQ